MITGNEPAMPTTPDGLNTNNPIGGGLTIRQHFASLAMQKMTGFNLGQNYEVGKEIAKRAVIQADFLIAELNKEQK